jgi:uracil phosphoribosyltransferase
MNRIILKAEDLDGFLTENDKSDLLEMDTCYHDALACFNILLTIRLAAGEA